MSDRLHLPRGGPVWLFSTLGVAYLVALGVFAYFASTVSDFPGEAGASTWVQSWRAAWMDVLMEYVSAPGTLVVAVPMVLLTSAALYVRGWRADGLLLLSTTIAGRALALMLKEGIGRERPADDLVQVLQQAHGPSFPSGHVMHYVVFFGTLGVILTMRMRPGIGLRLTQGAVVIALLAVGLSRIYLGVHRMGDIIGGYAFGIAVVVCALLVWRAMIERRSDRGIS